MTAESPLDYLFGLEQHGIKLGLDNIRTLCEALDHPERAFASVIVAGTNGKGSVTTMIETALRAGGLTTGRFTSPHLVELEERFVLNGCAVDRRVLTREAAALRAVVHRLLASGRLTAPPTFFEATTAMAFALFRRSNVDVAVLEVGMGGRFDATNVVSPVAAVITTIDLDHRQYLGETLPEIAYEKAGVIKPGTLVVTGETKPPVLAVLRRVCAERDARLVEAVADVTTEVVVRNGLTELSLTTPVRAYGRLLLSLRGRHQVANAVVAVRLLEELSLGTGRVSKTSITSGLTRTVWPGRLELVRADRGWVLLDSAHNPAAAKALGHYLADAHPAGLPLVMAAMRDKDVPGILRELEPFVTQIVCTPLRNQRAYPAEQLAVLVHETCPSLRCRVADSPEDALNIAWRHSDTVCAAGSIYLVGEIIDRACITGSTDAHALLPG